jgi:8-hydroxy-5-deazaflavin:NADPH oxidoreductase
MRNRAEPELGVLGTGQVGQAIARRAAEVGYSVTVGARSAQSSSLSVFAEDAGIRTGSFSDAVRAAGLVVNATRGDASLAVLSSVGPDALAGKVLLDVSNELVPVADGFPVPAASADNSLGLRLQQAFPGTSVVKALNTMTNQIMVRPDLIPGDHVVFLSGDDPDAKAAVRVLLGNFGWREPQMLDLGGIDTAAAVEMMMAIWMRVTLARGSGAPRFNWGVLSA